METMQLMPRPPRAQVPDRLRIARKRFRAFTSAIGLDADMCLAEAIENWLAEQATKCGQP